ncbi:MAG TPA: type II CAAX endopeptidase family protein [Caulobacteraceae bacterium]|jgi:membrane protease YdiL (CAAX protease family)
MRLLLRRITTVALAALVAFAITAIGQALWGVMVSVNLKVSPAIPWAALMMPFVLAGLVAFLAGRSWPHWGADARRALVPLAPVPAQAWIWAIVSGAVGIAVLAAFWTVAARIVRVPPNLLTDLSGVPIWTQAAFLLVAIAAAPLTEEIAFRGYAMGILRREFGPAGVLVLSSLMFAAAHLTQGLVAPKLIVYLLVGLGLGAIVMRTGSLLPAMVVHSMGDLAFFTLVWSQDAHRRLISQGGADAGFYATVAILVVGLPIWVVTWRRFLKATRKDARTGPPSINDSLATA